MNPLIMQFRLASCYFFSLRSKHSPHHPVLHTLKDKKIKRNWVSLQKTHNAKY